MKLTLQFSPNDLAAVHDRLGNFTPRLQNNLKRAIYHQLQIAQGRAVSYMWEMFKHPTGELAEGFDPITVFVNGKSVSGILSNTREYAWRREEGFSKKTDRLGRYYKKAPGIHYMRFVMRAQRQSMVDAVKDAVNDTLSGQVTRA